MKTCLVDVRSLTSEQRRDVFKFLDAFADLIPPIVGAKGLVGYMISCTHDCSSAMEKLPHKCPYKNVDKWDLSDLQYAFSAAFPQIR